MSSLPIRYALLFALAASVATVAGVALYVAVEDPRAVMVGVGFGSSLMPHGALLALPVGVLLGGLRPRVGSRLFMVLAVVLATMVGATVGWWVASDSHMIFQPVSVFLAATWAIAGGFLVALSRRSP